MTAKQIARSCRDQAKQLVEIANILDPPQRRKRRTPAMRASDAVEAAAETLQHIRDSAQRQGVKLDLGTDTRLEEKDLVDRELVHTEG